MLKPLVQANYLKALKGYDLFEAQTQLEDELFSAKAAQLLTLQLDNDNIMIEYAKVRGAIDVLKQLKAMREQIISTAVEKTLNS